jgi:hypothetical protein
VTPNPFNNDPGSVVQLLMADTVLSDSGDWMVDQVKYLGEGTWLNRHIKVFVYSATAVLGLSGTQCPTKIDLTKVDPDVQTIEDQVGFVMMLQHISNDKYPPRSSVVERV